MSNFNPVIEAQLSGATVRVAALASFDFVSGMRRYWTGFGPLVAGGELWQGVGNMARLSPIQAGPGQAVEEITISIFGDASLTASIRDELDETNGQEFRLYRQFFDDEWSTLGDLQHVFRGTMGPLQIEWPPTEPGGRIQRAITVKAMNPLFNRRRPPNAFFSDRDQKARSGSPEDNICVSMSTIKHVVRWPFFSGS